MSRPSAALELPLASELGAPTPPLINTLSSPCWRSEAITPKVHLRTPSPHEQVPNSSPFQTHKLTPTFLPHRTYFSFEAVTPPHLRGPVPSPRREGPHCTCRVFPSPRMINHAGAHPASLKLRPSRPRSICEHHNPSRPSSPTGSSPLNSTTPLELFVPTRVSSRGALWKLAKGDEISEKTFVTPVGEKKLAAPLKQDRKEALETSEAENWDAGVREGRRMALEGLGLGMGFGVPLASRWSLDSIVSGGGENEGTDDEDEDEDATLVQREVKSMTRSKGQ